MKLLHEYREFAASLAGAVVVFLAVTLPQRSEQAIWPHRLDRLDASFPACCRATSLRDRAYRPVADSIRKVFIHPSRGRGTCLLGHYVFCPAPRRVATIESEKPIWYLREQRRPFTPPIFVRCAQAHHRIRLSSCRRARRPSIRLCRSGLWYPWFPTEDGLMEGTRIALGACYGPTHPRHGFMSRCPPALSGSGRAFSQSRPLNQGPAIADWSAEAIELPLMRALEIGMSVGLGERRAGSAKLACRPWPRGLLTTDDLDVRHARGESIARGRRFRLPDEDVGTEGDVAPPRRMSSPMAPGRRGPRTTLYPALPECSPQ